MSETNQNNPQQEDSCAKSCLVVVLTFLIIAMAFVLIVTTVVGIIRSDENSNNKDTPSLISRKATLNDITINSDESNLISIEIIVIPKHDIDNLELTIHYYSSSNTLLKTVTQQFGDVKEDGRYTKQVYITDFSLSEILKLDYCKFTVTGGRVSYFA